jgi:hypothetical protein
MPSRSFEPVTRWMSGPALGLIALTVLVLSSSRGQGAGPGYPITIDVQNATAKVGERAVIVATITITDGFKVTDSYGHRLSGLSADDGVEFERRLVRGSIRNDRIVFLVPVTPTRAGIHAVSGLFRFSYHNGQELDIRAARFEATVTGIE